jgi:predicted GIY-YIG superfamily endonuclease
MPKRFVYVLKNSEVPPRYYTGLSANLSNRLGHHNTGHQYAHCQVSPLVA